MLSPRCQSPPEDARLRATPLVDVELALHPRQLGVARSLVDRAARDSGFSEPESFDLVFAVNEAITNAVRHAPQVKGATVGLRIDAQPDGLAVTVRCGGTFTAPVGSPDPWAEGGRGFHYMRVLVDDVHIHHFAAGTAVRLYKARTAVCALD